MATVRLPVSFSYNNRSRSAAETNVDVERVNVMEEWKDTASAEAGKYTMKRPGLEYFHQFRPGIGQALTFWNDSFYAVTDDYLQATNPIASAADGTNWTTGIVAPWSPRWDHQVVVCNGIMYLIGGFSPGSTPSAQADVWWTTDGIKWTVANGAAPFGGRYGHRVAVVGKTMYLMGGYDASNAVTNDVWSSDDGTTWTQLTDAAPWDARADFCAVATGNGIYLFSGINSGGTRLNDIWYSSNGAYWTQVATAGGSALWSGRSAAMAWNYRNAGYIAGGATGGGTSLNDVWKTTDGGVTWTQLTTNAFTIGGLAYSGAVIYEDKMWVIGGRKDSSTRSDDVYSSTDGITWTRVTTNGPGPAVQEAAAAVYYTPTTFGYQSIWYMGGTSGSSVGYNTTYYGTLNLTILLSQPLNPVHAGQPFQFQSFSAGTQLVVKNQSQMWVIDGSHLTEVVDKGFPSETVPGMVEMGKFLYVMDVFGLIRNCEPNDPFHWFSENNLGADYEDDPPVALVKYQNYVVAFGTYTIQFFYDAGNPVGSPLSPYLNANQMIGCASAKTIANIGSTIAWVSQSRELHRQVVFLNGLQPQVISTPYIEKMMGGTGSLSAVSCSVEGHMFYVLTVDPLLPSWAFDFTTKEWFKWKTFVTQPIFAEGAFNFPAFTTNFTGGGTYLLTPIFGQLYLFSANLYGDGNNSFSTLCQTPKVDFGNNRTKFAGQLELVGDRNNAGFAFVSFSDDDYATFSTPRAVNLADPRAVLYRNGKFRRRSFRFTTNNTNPLRMEDWEVTYEQGM